MAEQTARGIGAAVQSVSFARPHFDEVLKAIDFINLKDYPPRGDA